jgi:hypothetical protein
MALQQQQQQQQESSQPWHLSSKGKAAGMAQHWLGEHLVLLAPGL